VPDQVDPQETGAAGYENSLSFHRKDISLCSMRPVCPYKRPYKRREF
jgi:hypothetical protein